MGYLIQPVAFFMVAGLFLKLVSALRQKLSQQEGQQIKQEKYLKTAPKMMSFQETFAFFRFPEFDLLSASDERNHLWNVIRSTYVSELILARSFLRFPAKLLSHIWMIFPFAEVVGSIAILIAYLLFALLGSATLMVAVIELLNFSVIGMVILLGVSAFLPVRAFHRLTNSFEFNPRERKQIALALSLIHLSHFLRIWGFFWKLRYIIRWLFVEGSGQESAKEMRRE